MQREKERIVLVNFISFLNVPFCFPLRMYVCVMYDFISSFYVCMHDVWVYICMHVCALTYQSRYKRTKTERKRLVFSSFFKVSIFDFF